jgi:hypothetical protein
MTRAREVEPGSEKMPDYKSPSNRLVHSLRKGYDNLRGKIKEARVKIKYYQIKSRDLEKSRTLYKEESKIMESKIKQLKKENAKLTVQNKRLEESLKKNL